MKDKLELCVTRLSDSNEGLRKKALDMIKTDIRGATSSMTSVPKPLKFMTPQYEKLTKAYNDYTKNDSFKVSIIPFFKNLNQILLLYLERAFRPLFCYCNGCCTRWFTWHDRLHT